MLARLFSEWCAPTGDTRSTREANAVERGFILRTVRHVTELPLSFFPLRANGAVARQVDQADEISPIFTALSKEIWLDVFSLAILAILISMNLELALIRGWRFAVQRAARRRSRYGHRGQAGGVMPQRLTTDRNAIRRHRLAARRRFNGDVRRRPRHGRRALMVRLKRRRRVWRRPAGRKHTLQPRPVSEESLRAA